MLAMIAGLHSPRRKPQVNAMDQVFGTYRPGWAGGAGANSGWPRMVTSPSCCCGVCRAAQRMRCWLPSPTMIVVAAGC